MAGVRVRRKPVEADVTSQQMPAIAALIRELFPDVTPGDAVELHFRKLAEPEGSAVAKSRVEYEEVLTMQEAEEARANGEKLQILEFIA